MPRLAAALLLLLFALGACGRERDRAPRLDDYGEVPRFVLRDQTGATLTESWLRGHVTVVNIIFTRSDTICPVLSLKMARLDEQTRDLGDAVHLLSFSVDPAYDQPAVLAEYAGHFAARPERWRFATGDYAEVRAMVEGALMTAMDPADGTTAGGAPDIKHGGHFLLVDRDLHIRGIYDSSEDARMNALALDIRRLATRR
jgi:protein SCO1